MYYSRLKDLREDNDLVQKQIADILGIDQRVYSNYETGKREIPTRLVIKLAKYYKTSTDYILGLKKTFFAPYDKMAKNAFLEGCAAEVALAFPFGHFFVAFG